MDEYSEVFERATEALEDAGFEPISYSARFTGENIWTNSEDPEEALQEVQEQLQGRSSVSITVEEPYDENGERLFGYDIQFVSDEETGYFRLQRSHSSPEVSEMEADQWRAKIERALLDHDLPVMLGDIYDEDNSPTTGI